MPVYYGKDKQGCFAQWGTRGAKYHYRCGDKRARKRATKKAEKQAHAIFASGWKGN